MPELPDVEVYRERLDAHLRGQVLERVRLASVFLLRTAEPPLAAAHGRRFVAFERVGKRLALGLEGDLWLVIHLMVAGRLRWRPPGAKVPARLGVAAFDTPVGTLLLTEAGTKKRASLQVFQGYDAVRAEDRGGIDPRTAGVAEVADRLRGARHTLKRSLCDPTLFDGIGGAYADEILWAAGLSPVGWSDQVDDDGVARLTDAMREVLLRFTDALRAEVGDGFPEEVTAFRPDMAVHGRYRQPCPRCGTEVQRIVYATRETNYCPACQTGGRILKDRALSALLRKDWPRTVEALEALRRR